MPRPPRIRQSTDAEPCRPREARRAWVRTWKEWAMREWPPDTPRATRVQVRAAVEHALSRFSPEDDEAELRDVVAEVIEEARARRRREADQATRAKTKDATLAGTEQLLATVLLQLPRDQVGPMLRRPGYSYLALAHRLRRVLSRQLTGAEPPEQVLELVVAWVERRVAEQATSRDQRAGRIGKAIDLVSETGAAILQRPEVRDAALRQLAKFKEQARAWLEKRIPPQPPGPS